MPLSYLSGDVSGKNMFKCLNLGEDLCYLGVRSIDEYEEQ